MASEFGAIGEEVGRSILIGDCCFDFEKDLFKREFNPICNRDEIPAAINAALRSLSRLGWLCDEMGRTNSQTSALPTALPAAIPTALPT
ncbi:MAG: hypothetical protein AB8B55_00850, partial [Mariniblastus sp.]